MDCRVGAAFVPENEKCVFWGIARNDINTEVLLVVFMVEKFFSDVIRRITTKCIN